MLGIFDSGMGGLSVWKELKKLDPSKGVLYFADTARFPYGNLSRDKLFIYAKECIDHLVHLGATSIAIACHTIATTVAPLLKHSSPIPIYDIASHSLSLFTHLERVAIIGTKATIASQFYQKHLGEKVISTLSCPLLVPMIEAGVIDLKIIQESLAPLNLNFGFLSPLARDFRTILHRPPSALRSPVVLSDMGSLNRCKLVAKLFSPQSDKPKTQVLNRNADALFLACTHFPLIKEALQSYLGGLSLIDPSTTFALHLQSLTKSGPDEFYTTGDPLHFQQCATIFCKEQKVPFPFLVKPLYLVPHS